MYTVITRPAAQMDISANSLFENERTVRNFVFANHFNLNDIVLILSLSSNGNMSATARELGVDVSTVSRRVTAAEKALGTRLFVRTDSRFELTEAGAIFVAQGERIHDQIVSMMLSCSEPSTGMAGLVRITAVEFLFDYWLINHLPALQAAHPELQISLLASDSNLSFTRREADFALRLARPTEDAAIRMRKLGDLGFAVYASPRFAAVPRKEWADQPWISYNEALSHTPEMQWLERLGPDTRKTLRVSNLGTMVRACLAGSGLALMPCLLGSQTDLVRLSKKPETTRELWLLSHRDTGSIARFKTVSAWLISIFEASQNE
jgi:DNA-binding transcriptional LysR family regulator